jgi:hypothetical protein
VEYQLVAEQRVVLSSFSSHILADQSRLFSKERITSADHLLFPNVGHKIPYFVHGRAFRHGGSNGQGAAHQLKRVAEKGKWLHP